MDRWFDDALYPLQDAVLAAMAAAGTRFYLTGGTALGRVHLHHRYSDDLDLFVNDDDRFPLWVDRAIETWRQAGHWTVVNDVRSRVGSPVAHPTLGLVDTPENILAN